MKELIELIKALWAAIIPSHDADPERIYQWRVRIGLVIMTNTVAVPAFVALALGVFPAVFPGFVKASELTPLHNEVAQLRADNQVQIAELKANNTALQINQLDSKILDTRSRQCGAIKARTLGNHDPNLDSVIGFATERLQTELDQYWSLAQRRYRLPGCDEL